ncbi:hypothetical protein [Glycomyces buryatensis]|uniref:Uncharacterized protein n=1 Tax=Glycomyces buryatensis TaxID=2570927 RepID=A0A4S8PUM9_9ACTN|nr:hypothetical protein [Glycomyces buryatensis]THV35213.1 hypothetical protein FAB82_23400 [Glycomyces buryatensis]
MEIEDHPGFYGFGMSDGTIAIHADWPTYPMGGNAMDALLALAAFPEGARFTAIDDIDRAILFIGWRFDGVEDPFDRRNLHAAVWHQALLDAMDHRYISGIERISEREHHRRYRAELPSPLYHKLPDGTFELLELPPLNEYDDDVDEDGNFDPSIATWVGFSSPEKHVEITGSGHRALVRFLASELKIPREIRKIVNILIDAGAYDTAIRETAVLVEFRIRQWCTSKNYGIRLINEFIENLEASGYPHALAKILQGELRTLFSFVRNEFAHNRISLSDERGRAILARLGFAWDAVEALTQSDIDQD